MPISFVRRVTVYASSPYNPIAASSAPSAPKKPASVAVSRSGTIDASTCAASVVTVETRTFFSTSRTTRRTSPVTAAGATLVRSENCDATCPS